MSCPGKKPRCLRARAEFLGNVRVIETATPFPGMLIRSEDLVVHPLRLLFVRDLLHERLRTRACAAKRAVTRGSVSRMPRIAPCCAALLKFQTRRAGVP